MSEREDVISKIRALRAKASNTASSEAEAMSAAMMAAKLLNKFEIKENELSETKSLGAIEGKADMFKVLPEVLRYCWHGIQELTETKAYLHDNFQFRFIGASYDVEMALYLVELIVGASKRAWLSHAEGEALGLREMLALRSGFLNGFGKGVEEKLLEMAYKRKRDREQQMSNNSSTALVVVKKDLIKKWMDGNGMRLVKGKTFRPNFYNNRMEAAGFKAGGAVNLGRPFGGNNNSGELEA